MMDIKLRKMTEADIPPVTALEQASFAHPWPEREIRYEITENPCSVIYIAEKDGEIVGYLDFMITFDSATINRICVLPAHRKQGIAYALLEQMVKECKAQEEEVDWITLEVRKSNEAAIKLYEKNGYEYVTTKPHYYDDGEDAVYMMRSIVS